jgi:hypothetical protein
VTVHEFFDRYARLSQQDHPELLAALYGPTFIVGGPEGSMAFANDARFLDWLKQVRQFNQQHGMRGMAVISVGEQPLSPRHTLATVRWGARFERTGERVIEFTIAYLLERAAAVGWTILAYVSERDQAEAMKELGLLS